MLHRLAHTQLAHLSCLNLLTHALLQIACKQKHGRVFRLPYLTGTAVSVCDTEGIRLAMTTRYNGRKALGTQEVKSIGVMFGPRALSNASGAEHSRLKKLMHPTFSVSVLT